MKTTDSRKTISFVTHIFEEKITSLFRLTNARTRVNNKLRFTGTIFIESIKLFYGEILFMHSSNLKQKHEHPR